MSRMDFECYFLTEVEMLPQNYEFCCHSRQSKPFTWLHPYQQIFIMLLRLNCFCFFSYVKNLSCNEWTMNANEPIKIEHNPDVVSLKNTDKLSQLTLQTIEALFRVNGEGAYYLNCQPPSKKISELREQSLTWSKKPVLFSWNIATREILIYKKLSRFDFSRKIFAISHRWSVTKRNLFVIEIKRFGERGCGWWSDTWQQRWDSLTKITDSKSKGSR